jgi:uncharacterized protein with FMN-binding domain
MSKRPIFAVLLTTAGLVLLLTFKTPDAVPMAASNGVNTGGAGNGTAVQPVGAGAQPVSAGVQQTGAAQATTGTKGAGSGQFTGSAIQTPYGTVQVQVTLQGGKITDVQALKLPSGRGNTQQISSYASPQLRSEVLQAQSAKVNTISGATYTSQGYMQSVQSALDQAGF